jgi:hypothetical protein
MQGACIPPPALCRRAGYITFHRLQCGWICRVHASHPQHYVDVQGILLSIACSVDGCAGCMHSTPSTVDVQGILLSTACSVDGCAGCMHSTPSTVDVQGILLSHRLQCGRAGCIYINSPCSVDVQGVSLSAACCMEEQGVSNNLHHRQCGREGCIYQQPCSVDVRVFPSPPLAVQICKVFPFPPPAV